MQNLQNELQKGVHWLLYVTFKTITLLLFFFSRRYCWLIL